jgi:lysozyme
MDLEKLRKLIADHEGCKLKPYIDSVGKITIGFGRNLSEVGINDREASMMMNADIIRAHKFLDSNYPWFRRLSDVRQMAILDMAYNLGGKNFKEFHKMISALALSQFGRAADEALNSLWAEQVGRRAVEIAGMIRSDELPE